MRKKSYAVILLGFFFSIILLADNLSSAEPAADAPLQDTEGTPIYLTPVATTPAATVTPGPAPTPMKVAVE
jgi:hypothetical protein